MQACKLLTPIDAAMDVPQLPTELVVRIIKTGRYLERREALHDSRVWRCVRWHTDTKGFHKPQVPASWAANLWLLQLVRSLCSPSVRNIHLMTPLAG